MVARRLPGHNWRRGATPEKIGFMGRIDRVAFALALAGLMACQRAGRARDEAAARTDVTTWVGDTARAAIGDLDGDGRAEVVLADARQLRVVDRDGRPIAAIDAPGGPQVLVVRSGWILAGWGRSRERMDAPARITAHRLDGAALSTEEVVAPSTARPEIAAIVPGDDDWLVAWYDSEYTVQSARARRGNGGWTLDELGSIRMATSYARGDVDGDGEADLVVGRVYGDDRGVDGDAFLLGAGGARTPLPTVRGVRGLAVVDGEIFVGDGWHENYGEAGQGLLARIRRGAGGGFERTQLDDTPGQYTIWKIVPADLDGDRHAELVTMGSHRAQLYRRDGDRWTGLAIGGALRDVAAGDLDGDGRDEVLLVGETSEIVRLP